MYRWSECPGSVQLCEIADESPSSIHAQQGTIAHEVAAFFLERGYWPLPDEFGLTMSELNAMAKAISVYTDYILRMRIREPQSIFHVEHGFDMGMVYPNAFGTADFVAYNPATRHLRVIDYKHGAGLVVEVEKNTQLLYYALGAAVTLNYPLQTIELVVAQPRAFHAKGPIRNWFVTIEEMFEFMAYLRESAKKTELPNPTFKAGSHCFFCGAIDICPLSKEAKAAKRAKVMKPRVKTDPKDEFKVIS